MAVYICRQCRTKSTFLSLLIRSFSTSAQRSADDMATGLADMMSPAKTARPPTTPQPSRRPSEPSDSKNPSLFPPAGDEVKVGNTNSPRKDPSNLMSALRYSFNAAHRRTNTPGGRSEQAQRLESSRAFAARAQALEQQQARIWRDGDVYAPHDLSPVEQIKARAARAPPRARDMRPVNTRKGGQRDALDDLAINPLKEYKNFAMLSEFTTEMGRIRHARETGFRAVNQRKMAKAVRRAKGLGLMPSVHRHPEMHPERHAQRFYDQGRYRFS